MTEGTLTTIAVCCLWGAFAVVSVAVALTGGRGPLLRAKLRIGGLLLGLTAVAVTGCDGRGFNSCYKTSDSQDYDTDADTDADTDTDTDPDTDADTDADSDPNVDINEVAAGEGGWIELYNHNSHAWNMTGWMITDAYVQQTGLQTYALPEGTEIEAHGYLLLLASGNAVGLETDFELAPEGETVTLVLFEDWPISAVTYPALEQGQSYARSTDGNGPWVVTDTPTPGASNGG